MLDDKWLDATIHLDDPFCPAYLDCPQEECRVSFAIGLGTNTLRKLIDKVNDHHKGHELTLPCACDAVTED